MPVIDEEQHYDAFNMDNDYEGLVEIDGEFLFREKKKKRLQTREEQLYGYESSDDEDGGGGRRGGGKRSKADYSKPVGFVSSGVFVQQPEGDKSSNPPPQPQQQQPSKQQQQQRPSSADSGGSGGAGMGFQSGAGTGLGFSSGSSEKGRAGLGAGSSGGVGLGFSGAGGGGLGFKSGGVQTAADGSEDAAPRGGLGSGGRGGIGSSGGGWREAAKHQQPTDDFDDDDADEGEAAVLPTAFGRRIKAAAEKKQQQRAALQKASAERAAARTADPKFATFEQHTKGIGMKLLEKMGFQAGKGLGKQKQGIAKPLEAKLRPKGMGMGFGEYKESKMEVDKPLSAAAAAAAAADAAELEQEMAEAVAKTQAPLWKKKAAPARQKRTYKTAEEVLEASSAKPLAAQPILDMRGPQARLVTDLEQLNAAADGAAGADAGPPMPELSHNMGLLVSLTEAQLRRMDAALQHQQDTATLLVQEKERLEKELAAAKAAAERLTTLTSQLQSTQQQQLPLPALQQQYESMVRSFPEEYMLYNIAAAALNQVLPLLGQLLQGWQPLAQPELGTAQFKAWRKLLESEAARQSVLAASWEEAGDPYAELVLQLVLPPIRSAITHWEPRQPEPLLAWFDCWVPLLPRGASQQLLQGLVMPRIAAAVEGWDPTRETQPIHAWLHPWLPHLAGELQTVYPTIRHRLSRALTAWHASDASARVLLAPWQSVFEAADWEGLLQRSIMPKLAQSLQTELVLNPLSPQLDPFYWALSWHGLMPTGHLAALLETSFFPAWHALLYHWLSHSPNYDEVTRWYLQWKGLFPQDLLDHPRVRVGFSQALNMMNSAADGQPPLPPPAAPAAAGPAAAGASSLPSWRAEMAGAGSGTAGEPGQAAAAAAAGGRGGYGAAAEPSFKDLVAQYAQEQGFEFLPRAGRLHDGLPVYSFGGVSCVVDAAHSLIRAQLKERGWVPVSLEKLREEAASRQ